MLKIITFLCFGLVIDFHVTAEKNNEDDVGEPLYLSPLIEQNKIKEAQAAANVSLVGAENIVSYSGYLTVNGNTSSNLFFWFFLSMSDYKTDPLIIWLQGGPGTSPLKGLFVEHGPFQITDRMELQLRKISWVNNHSVLYIDNPVGVGFGDWSQDYETKHSEVTDQLYKALLQFFKMFPDLANNDVFIAGQKYAAKYVLRMGTKFMMHDFTVYPTKNLRGLIIGNGWVDPINQLNYGDFLYGLGLIDNQQLNKFYEAEDEILNIIKRGYYAAATLDMPLILAKCRMYTGRDNVYNYIHNNRMLSDSVQNMKNYIRQSSTRKALHVGSMLFNKDYEVKWYLKLARTRSVAYLIPKLLSNYRILIYTGQLDILVNYMGVTNYLEHLHLGSRNSYKEAFRRPWYVGENVAGYVKVAGNLTEVMVRNAGHFVPVDQPLWALDMITKFIRKQTLSTD